MEMEKVGIHVECQHHEVATAGQAEIDMRFSPLLEMGDKLLWFKYIVKNVARAPQQDRDLHAQADLRGQRLRHARARLPLEGRQAALCRRPLRRALARWRSTSPAASSSTRRRSPPSATRPRTPTAGWCPGYEAPINLAYSSRNRSAAVRIPMYSSSPKSKRLEFRTPDPSCNGYLAFASILMAGLDGVQNKIDPGEPLDKNIYKLSPEELKDVEHAPASLDEALRRAARTITPSCCGRRLHAGRDRHMDRLQDGPKR